MRVRYFTHVDFLGCWSTSVFSWCCNFSINKCSFNKTVFVGTAVSSVLLQYSVSQQIKCDLVDAPFPCCNELHVVFHTVVKCVACAGILCMHCFSALICTCNWWCCNFSINNAIKQYNYVSQSYCLNLMWTPKPLLTYTTKLMCNIEITFSSADIFFTNWRLILVN